MTTALLVAFLALHGLVHLAVWLPKPASDEPPPFEPGHSALLTATQAPSVAVHQLSVGLAVGAAAAYVLAAVAVALGATWTVPVAVASALLGLLLKVLYFHPWLTIGLLLDVGVLLAATVQWPVSLT